MTVPARFSDLRVVLILLLVLVAGCSGETSTAPPAATAEAFAPEEAAAPAPAEPAEPDSAPEEEPEPPSKAAVAGVQTERAARPRATACTAGAYVRMRTQNLAHGAVVREAAVAYRRPGADPLARFGRLNENGVPTVFGVLGRVVGPGCGARWYRVQLPMKPNGIVGYVRAADVELFPVRTRILVQVGARRVTLFDGGREAFAAPIAVGSSATPTPLGNFYVNQRLRPTDPSGPFGPGAIGISAFSEVLTGWAQGGPVALHGTNRPELIGHAVSNGCIRLRNADLERLFDRALPGTPVVVVP